MPTLPPTDSGSPKPTLHTRKRDSKPEQSKSAKSPKPDLAAEEAVSVEPVITRSTLVVSEYEPGVREKMIAEGAYYRAEQRGFAPGYEAEDWLAAEAEVDAHLYRLFGEGRSF